MMSEIDLPFHWRVVAFTPCLRKIKALKHPSIPQSHYQAKGAYPIIDQSLNSIAGYTDSTESVISDNLPVIIFGDHTRVFKYIDFSFAIGADGTKIIRVNDEILEPIFFFFKLLSLEIPNKGYSRHYKYLREFYIAYPTDKSEQRALAHTLRTIQKAKEARQRELELERERKATLMQYLFTYGTCNESTKQTEIGEIPESWQLVRLDSITEMASGGTPSKQRLDWWQGEIAWVSTKDLKQPRLWDTEDHISEEALQNGSRLVAAKTLFIAVRGMCLAKDIPVAMAEVPMAFNQDIKALMPLAHIDSEYLLYSLQFLKAHIMRFVGTSAHGTKRLGTSSLQAIQIPLPETEEQRLIANVLHGCERKITALEKEIAALDELFRAMLEELMSGRLSALPLVEVKV